MTPILAVGLLGGAVLGLIVAACLCLSAWMAEPQVIGPQDAQLTLHASATRTASGNGTGVDLGAGYAPSGGGQPMQAVISFSALDRAQGDETYSFRIEDSPDNSTWTARSADRTTAQEGFTSNGASGVFTIGANIVQRYVRIVWTLAGTTPSITFTAYLQPSVNSR
jgi:hypothetical protein